MNRTKSIALFFDCMAGLLPVILTHTDQRTTFVMLNQFAVFSLLLSSALAAQVQSSRSPASPFDGPAFSMT
ncbi:MAG TPA: hypothetical protein VGU23_03595, partial [Acidobacteriaceae bacterium]|nr:hypothetical protein [Acidobacteriaceae bacterium]